MNHKKNQLKVNSIYKNTNADPKMSNNRSYIRHRVLENVTANAINVTNQPNKLVMEHLDQYNKHNNGQSRRDSMRSNKDSYLKNDSNIYNNNSYVNIQNNHMMII